MRLDVEPIVRGLRTINGHGLKGLSITEMSVCGRPQDRGELSAEEYAPYLAAANATHMSYMRWTRTLMPPEALHSTVSVDQTVVAWLQYDGVVRVIDRVLSTPGMNTVRDLAREHLGQDPAVQQQLADRRADIGVMSAEGFERAIGEFSRRAAPDSKTNDYPDGMTVRQWEHANRRANTGHDKDIRPWVWPMNPTRSLTDNERAHWRRETRRYVEAFHDRFPQEHRQWDFRSWWESTRESRAGNAPLGLKADERILVEYNDQLIPAVVAWPMRKDRTTETVDLMVEPGTFPEGDNYLSWLQIYPGRALRYADVPQDVRAGWDSVWVELLKRVQEKFSGPDYNIRYDN